MFYQIIVTFKNNRRKIVGSTFQIRVAMQVRDHYMVRLAIGNIRAVEIRGFTYAEAAKLGFKPHETPPIIFGKNWA